MSKECDHIIGHVNGFEDECCHLVNVSDSELNFSWWMPDKFDKFAFCPICGERVNDLCDFED